jgi:hypothetical protein
VVEAEETVKMHLAQLKKDEATIAEAKRELEKEKHVHIRYAHLNLPLKLTHSPIVLGHGRHLLLSSLLHPPNSTVSSTS